MAVRTGSVSDKLGSHSLWKLIVRMSIPSIISMLFQSLYSLVNSVFLVHLSQNSLTVVSIAYPIQLCMSALGIGTGVAIASVVASYFGSNSADKVGRAVIHGIYIGIAYWFLFALLGPTLGVHLVTSHTNESELIENIRSYLTILTIGSLSFFIKTVLDRVLQGSGRVAVTMVSQVMGLVINIVLDPFLIFGIGGFPHLGVKGAAISTVIGQTVAAVFTVIIFIRHWRDYFAARPRFSLSVPILRDIYRIAAPYITMQMMGSIFMACINAVLGSFSNMAVDVMSICYRIQNFIYLPIFGLSNGIIPVFSYNYGKRDKKRLIDSIWLSSMISIGIMLIGVYLFCNYPEWWLFIFNPTPEMMSMATVAIRVLSLSYVMSAIVVVFTTFFYTVNCGKYAFFVSFVRQILVKIPMVFFLAKFGLVYVWFSFPIVEGIAVVITLVLYARVYQKKLKHLGQPEKGEAAPG